MSEDIVEIDGECWEWGGHTTKNGYGRVGHGRGSRLAHRRTYEALIGPIPEGLQLDHLCRNRACCNPFHLEPVTPAENSRRGDTGSWKRPDECIHGHNYAVKGVYVFPDGRRACKECRRIDSANRRAIRDRLERSGAADELADRLSEGKSDR